jgi:hypothetical protein
MSVEFLGQGVVRGFVRRLGGLLWVPGLPWALCKFIQLLLFAAQLLGLGRAHAPLQQLGHAEQAPLTRLQGLLGFAQARPGLFHHTGLLAMCILQALHEAGVFTQVLGRGLAQGLRRPTVLVLLREGFKLLPLQQGALQRLSTLPHSRRRLIATRGFGLQQGI